MERRLSAIFAADMVGYSRLMEASVVQAVQCAVEIQRAMEEHEAGALEGRRISYRIGIIG